MAADIITRMGRPKKSEKTENLRVPISLGRVLRRLATEEGLTPGDYLYREFMSELEKRNADLVAKLSADMKKPKPGSK